MGMFGDLMGKIFGQDKPADAPFKTQAGGTPESKVTERMKQGVPAPPAAGAGINAPVASGVDVAATLDKMASTNKEKLDWRHSIVDLMKLVGMDSSLSARKELAKDLQYTGDTSDSATMNMWLHKQVMKKLAENGGKVPADLLSH